jgi:hypothetical protein
MTRWTNFVLIATGAVAMAATVNAQRREPPVEWLPAADSLPASMATLLVLDRADRTPVDHPWICVDPGGGWMIGMPDGRVRFSRGEFSDTVHLRISGPWHEERAVALPWDRLQGRAAIITLARRSGGRVEPAC